MMGLAGGTALRLSHTEIDEAFWTRHPSLNTFIFLVVMMWNWLKYVPDGEHFLMSKHPFRLDDKYLCE